MADRVLVIEGSATLRDDYVRHLSSCGFDVRCATTLAEVQGLPDGPRFDAVIADVGGEAAALTPALGRWLESAAPLVVVLTAYGEPGRAADAVQLDPDAFLHKPASFVWLDWLLRSRIDAARLSTASGDVAPR